MQVRTGCVVRDQHEIAVFFLKPRLYASQEFHLDLDSRRHVRSRKGLHRGECRIERQDAINYDGKRGLPLLQELPCYGANVLRLSKQATSLGEYRFTRGRQVNTVAVTVEHGDSELLLDLSDLVADRRLDLVQMLGRTGETAVSHDRLEGFQSVQIELHGYSD